MWVFSDDRILRAPSVRNLGSDSYVRAFVGTAVHA